MRTPPRDPRLEVNYLGMRNPPEKMINRFLSEEHCYLNTSLHHLNITYYCASANNRPFPLTTILDVEGRNERRRETALSVLALSPTQPDSRLPALNINKCPVCLIQAGSEESCGYSWRITGCGHIICSQCIAAIIRPLSDRHREPHAQARCPICRTELVQNFRLYIFPVFE